MKDNPFWIDLIASWQGKRLVLGTFYKTLKMAKRHWRKGMVIYQIDTDYFAGRPSNMQKFGKTRGYLVAKDIKNSS